MTPSRALACLVDLRSRRLHVYLYSTDTVANWAAELTDPNDMRVGSMVTGPTPEAAINKLWELHKDLTPKERAA